MLFSDFVYSVCEWKQTGQEGSCSAGKTAGRRWIPRGPEASGDTSVLIFGYDAGKRDFITESEAILSALVCVIGKPWLFQPLSSA